MELDGGKERIMRLIDADKLMENKFKNDISYNAFCNLVKRQPSIDAVKHGRWTRLGDNSYKCSECGEVSCCFADYCPDCGARMDGEENG